MTGTRSKTRRDEVPGRELRRQEPKELPRREGTFDTLVEQAERAPEPEELAATAAKREHRDEPEPEHERGGAK